MIMSNKNMSKRLKIRMNYYCQNKINANIWKMLLNKVKRKYSNY